MVAQTRGGGTTNPLKKLQFKEKLVGKGYSTDVLLKKLKALHEELAGLDQDHVDTKSLSVVKKELVQAPILLHKDKGVKAHVACCLADLLRLYAPDAPYTSDELRDIFQFFFRQLSNGLKGPNSPYYNQYFHLLESLSTVRSVVLVCDLPHADSLMADIFRDLFTLIRNDLAKNIETCMMEILGALIDEAQSIPHTVLDTIMTQFLDKSARMDQPGYRLAVEVCNATADKLQRYVCQYFTDIIIQHSKDDDFSEIRTAHELIKQINRDCPTLLHNVVPQLGQELQVEEYEIRLLATQVLGEMFAEKGGSGVANKYPHVWDVWQARKNDKASGIRIAFIEGCQGVITLHPELRKSIEEALCVKLLDPEDRVRAVTCKLYSQLDYETALHHVSEAQLRAVGERCLDKKHTVRSEAMHTLGKLYNVARPEIENNDPAAIKQFSWIPENILHAAAANMETRVLVEQVLAQHILPFPSKSDDEAAWVDQLLSVMKYLDERATVTLLNLTGIKQTRPSVFERFIQCCEENNGGIIDENEAQITRRLNLVVQHIATLFPDRAKVAEDLHAFAKLNEGRLYKLFKTCADTQVDLKTLVKSTNEFLRRVEQAASSIIGTMTAVHRKAGLWIVNSSSVPSLVQYIQRANVKDDEAERLACIAKTVLAFVAKHCPTIFKPHTGELTKALTEEKNARLGEVVLQALAAVRWNANERRTKDRIVKHVLSSHARHAKFAARLIAHMREHEELAINVVSKIASSLPDVEEDFLVAHLAALAEFAKAAPDAFEQKSDVIIGFLVKQVLVRPNPASNDAMETDEDEWGLESEISALAKAKLLNLKICRNRCLALGSTDSAKEVGTPVLKMLFTLLEHGGSMAEDVNDDVKVQSRMRLLATTCLIQLAILPAYSELITPNFTLLALTMQDPCFNVRIAFLTKLIACLSTAKLDSRFNVIMFLAAHDPEREVRDKVRSYVSIALARASPETRVASFEMIFLRLLHLLAHHPDFTLAIQNLQDTTKYIEFYLDIIATADNIPLLYHLAMKGKTVRDISDAHNENLYIVSELAQEIIRHRAKLNSWQLPSYPGKVKLPSDIFKGFPNAEAANKVHKKVYLPGEMVTWLGELGKTVRSPNAKGKGRVTGEFKGSRKRKMPIKPRVSGGTRKPQKKKRKKDSDEDEDANSVRSDEEAGSKSESDSSSEDEGDAGSDTKEGDQLGRGARGCAKKRARKEAKKAKREEKNGK